MSYNNNNNNNTINTNYNNSNNNNTNNNNNNNAMNDSMHMTHFAQTILFKVINRENKKFINRSIKSYARAYLVLYRTMQCIASNSSVLESFTLATAGCTSTTTPLLIFDARCWNSYS